MIDSLANEAVLPDFSAFFGRNHRWRSVPSTTKLFAFFFK